MSVYWLVCGFYILALLGTLSHLHWLLCNLAVLEWIDPFDRMAYVGLTNVASWCSCVSKDTVERQDVKSRLWMSVSAYSAGSLGIFDLNLDWCVLIFIVVVDWLDNSVQTLWKDLIRTRTAANYVSLFSVVVRGDVIISLLLYLDSLTARGQ